MNSSFFSFVIVFIFLFLFFVVFFIGFGFYLVMISINKHLFNCNLNSFNFFFGYFNYNFKLFLFFFSCYFLVTINSSLISFIYSISFFYWVWFGFVLENCYMFYISFIYLLECIFPLYLFLLFLWRFFNMRNRRNYRELTNHLGNNNNLSVSKLVYLGFFGSSRLDYYNILYGSIKKYFLTFKEKAFLINLLDKHIDSIHFYSHYSSLHKCSGSHAFNFNSCSYYDSVFIYLFFVKCFCLFLNKDYSFKGFRSFMVFIYKLEVNYLVYGIEYSCYDIFNFLKKSGIHNLNSLFTGCYYFNSLGDGVFSLYRTEFGIFLNTGISNLIISDYTKTSSFNIKNYYFSSFFDLSSIKVHGFVLFSPIKFPGWAHELGFIAFSGLFLSLYHFLCGDIMILRRVISALYFSFENVHTGVNRDSGNLSSGFRIKDTYNGVILYGVTSIGPKGFEVPGELTSAYSFIYEGLSTSWGYKSKVFLNEDKSVYQEVWSEQIYSHMTNGLEIPPVRGVNNLYFFEVSEAYTTNRELRTSDGVMSYGDLDYLFIKFSFRYYVNYGVCSQLCLFPRSLSTLFSGVLGVASSTFSMRDSVCGCLKENFDSSSLFVCSNCCSLVNKIFYVDSDNSVKRIEDPYIIRCLPGRVDSGLSYAILYDQAVALTSRVSCDFLDVYNKWILGEDCSGMFSESLGRKIIGYKKFLYIVMDDSSGNSYSCFDFRVHVYKQGGAMFSQMLEFIRNINFEQFQHFIPDPFSLFYGDIKHTQLRDDVTPFFRTSTYSYIFTDPEVQNLLKYDLKKDGIFPILQNFTIVTGYRVMYNYNKAEYYANLIREGDGLEIGYYFKVFQYLKVFIIWGNRAETEEEVSARRIIAMDRLGGLDIVSSKFNRNPHIFPLIDELTVRPIFDRESELINSIRARLHTREQEESELAENFKTYHFESRQVSELYYCERYQHLHTYAGFVVTGFSSKETSPLNKDVLPLYGAMSRRSVEFFSKAIYRDAMVWERAHTKRQEYWDVHMVSMAPNCIDWAGNIIQDKYFRNLKIMLDILLPFSFHFTKLGAVADIDNPDDVKLTLFRPKYEPIMLEAVKGSPSTYLEKPDTAWNKFKDNLKDYLERRKELNLLAKSTALCFKNHTLWESFLNLPFSYKFNKNAIKSYVNKNYLVYKKDLEEYREFIDAEMGAAQNVVSNQDKEELDFLNINLWTIGGSNESIKKNLALREQEDLQDDKDGLHTNYTIREWQKLIIKGEWIPTIFIDAMKSFDKNMDATPLIETALKVKALREWRRKNEERKKK